MGKKKGNPALSGERSCKKRKKMADWLRDLLEEGSVEGLEWVSREEGEFQVPWTHASRKDYHQDVSTIFKLWAKHTGKYVSGQAGEAPKVWKSNFRCALNSLDSIEEVKEKSHRKGPNAVRIYKYKKKSVTLVASPATTEPPSPSSPLATPAVQSYRSLLAASPPTQDEAAGQDTWTSPLSPDICTDSSESLAPTSSYTVPSPSDSIMEIEFALYEDLKVDNKMEPPSPQTDTELPSENEDPELQEVLEGVVELVDDYSSPLLGNPMFPAQNNPCLQPDLVDLKPVSLTSFTREQF